MSNNGGPSLDPEDTFTRISSGRPSQLALSASISFNGYDPFDASITSVDGILSSYISFFATSIWPVYSSKKSAGTFMSSFGSMAVTMKLCYIPSQLQLQLDSPQKDVPAREEPSIILRRTKRILYILTRLWPPFEVKPSMTLHTQLQMQILESFLPVHV
jgi:hypothetical protein